MDETHLEIWNSGKSDLALQEFEVRLFVYLRLFIVSCNSCIHELRGAVGLVQMNTIYICPEVSLWVLHFHHQLLFPAPYVN